MQITVTSATDPIELYHLSILFQSLAKAHGFTTPVEAPSSASQTRTVGEMSVTLNVDTTDATSAVEALADLIDRTGVKVEDVPPVNVSVGDPVTAHFNGQPGGPVKGVSNAATVDIAPPLVVREPGVMHEVVVKAAVTQPPENNTNLDADGLPWDARIHSGSRALNVDGTWRTARRPKAMNEDEWQATLTRVNAELRDLMDIPVSTGATADPAAEIQQIDLDAFAALVADLTPPPVVVAPPVNVAPPAVEKVDTAIVPPPVTATKPAIETFPQVMVWLTSHTPKDESAKQTFVASVNDILSKNGLTVLTQLGQRPDLIPQVMGQFIEAFGE